MNLLDASTRVAFAAMLHDVGKFLQRTGLPMDHLDDNKDLYCPRKYDEKHEKFYWTHVHAAYSALGLDTFEKNLPNLVKGDLSPFSNRNLTNPEEGSFINALAKHHQPKTFLQWIIAKADRISSALERSESDEKNINYRKERLQAITTEIDIGEKTDDSTQEKYHKLCPLCADALFPKGKDEVIPESEENAAEEYRKLWESFSEAISSNGETSIPKLHRENWSLWLDHFDTAWLTYTSFIPSSTFKTVPDISLYDHSKSTAAFATALWRWHHDLKKEDEEAIKNLKENLDSDVQKFLIIQGEFHGIQKFIFGEGSQTNKKKAKLLRGRSFFVSLLSELVALKVLEELELPSTSQMISAAGKFQIVAPNTEEVKEKLNKIKEELDKWFIENLLGTTFNFFRYAHRSQQGRCAIL